MPVLTDLKVFMYNPMTSWSLYLLQHKLRVIHEAEYVKPGNIIPGEKKNVVYRLGTENV